MIASRRRVSLVLLAGFLLPALLPMAHGGAQVSIPATDLTPIDIPGPEIPPINTQPSGQGPGIVPIQQPTPTLVPIFPTEDLEPPDLPVNPNLPDPNIPPLGTEDPALEPTLPAATEEPTAAPSPTTVAGFGNLTISSRVCDNQGFNPYASSSLSKVLAECPAADREFEFTLVSSSSGYSKTLSTTGGMITEVVPSPGVTIKRSAVAGYDLSEISCGNDPFNKDSPKSIAHYSSASIAPGESVTCYWFSVLASTDVNIAIDAITCAAVPPLTTPTATVTETDLDGKCAWPPLEGLTFTLADADPATADQVAVTDLDPAMYARAEFTDLAPGSYSITLTPPAGATHAYVLSCGTGFGGPPTYAPAVVTGSGFTFTVAVTDPGESYHCRWNIVKP